MAKTITQVCLRRGKAREVNADSAFILDHSFPAPEREDLQKSAASQKPRQYFAVAGGLGEGENAVKAANLMLKVLKRKVEQEKDRRRFDFLHFARDLVDQANRAVRQVFDPAKKDRVGASFSLLCLDGETAYTLALGNSPIFLYRDARLHRLTRDHVQEQTDGLYLSRYLGDLAQPKLSEDDNLTRSLLQRGDILLLMTDGLTRYLNEAAIRAVLDLPLAFVQQIERLRDQAFEQGGEDDLALIGIKVIDLLTDETQDKAKPTANAASSEKRPPQRRRKKKGPGQVLGLIGTYLAFVGIGLLLGRLIYRLPEWLAVLSG